MSCNDPVERAGKDGVELVAGPRVFDVSTTAWLLGEAVRYLNTADEEGALAYRRVIEILADRPDALKAARQAAFRAPAEDVPLRWSLLHVIGDFADGKASEFLAGAALDPLPATERNGGCEGARDGELLIRTMAVESLLRVAKRHPDAAEQVLKVVAARPEQPVMIEALKAAADLGLAEKVRGTLGTEDHWMLDIRRARIDEINADPERKDGKERGFTPPKLSADHTAPSTCHCRKEI